MSETTEIAALATEAEVVPQIGVGDRVRLATGATVEVLGVRRSVGAVSLMLAGGSWVDGADAVIAE